MERFLPGDRVRVRSTRVDTHHRTPGYVKGKAGRVQALAGSFYDPQLRAYDGTGLPKRALYRVEFEMGDLWGEDYGGPTHDRLLVDIFEQWLERATDQVGSECAERGLAEAKWGNRTPGRDVGTIPSPSFSTCSSGS